jgi:hypothetical protein
MSKHAQCCCGARTIATISIYGKARQHYQINTTCVQRKLVARATSFQSFPTYFTNALHLTTITHSLVQQYPPPLCQCALHLRASMIDERCLKILIYKQPTMGNGRDSQVSLSEMFVLNDEHHYTWTITGIDYSQTDAHYVTYIACGTNCHGNVSVVVPRKWSEV